MQHPREYDIWLRHFIAATIGLTVPAMASGRAVLQGLAAAALIATLVAAARDTRIFACAGEAVRSRFGLVVLAAFTGMAVSIPGSLDPLRSFDSWARTLAYIGSCTLFWSALQTSPAMPLRVLRWLTTGILCASFIVVIGHFGFIWPLQIVRNDWGNFGSTWPFLTAKAFAAAAACTLPVLAWAAWTHRGRWRAAAGLSIGLIMVIIIGSGNKSALAGLLLGLLATTLAFAIRRGRRWFAVWTAWALVLSGATLTTVYKIPDAAPSQAVWEWLPTRIVDTHRQQIWNFTMTKISEAPWTGHGINVINRVPGAKEKPPGYDVEYLPSHPHNWILEILAETGIIGLLPVLLALGWVAVRHLRRYLISARPVDIVQIGLFSVFWGSSLFNFSIWSSWWLITYFLLTAMVGVIGLQDQDAEDINGAARP